MRIDPVRIREAYAGHPLPHSIRALSDTLDELHVPNIVCRLEFGQLFEIGGPFVVKVGEEEFPFFLAESLDRERQVIVLRSAAGRRIEIPFDNFRILWDGTTLLAQKGEEMNEVRGGDYLCACDKNAESFVFKGGMEHANLHQMWASVNCVDGMATCHKLS